MATKLNIFSALPQEHSDSEDEGKVQKNKQQGKRDEGKKQDKPKDKPVPTNAPKTVEKEHPKDKDHNPKKAKGVPESGTHPQDRHSGTKQHAYDKKLKKDGAGKGNWGSSKDDRKADEKEEGKEQTEEVQKKEPEGITLEEYYNKTKLHKDEPKINEAKAKVTSEQLMKELLAGKATLLSSKASADEKTKQTKKKEVVAEEHPTANFQQHADILGFRTGFVEREFRDRTRTEGDQKPGEGEHRREFHHHKREEKNENSHKKDDENKEGEEGTPEGEGKTEGGEHKRGGYQGRSRGGHYKSRGGNYHKGEKRTYNPQPKINIDESAFPKLG